MSSAEYDRLLTRRNEARPEIRALSKAVEKEAKLHECIKAEIRRRGWIAFHGSMAHKTYRTPGEPDWVVLAGNGRTHFIECKTSKGKLSTDQLAVQAWARKLGHKVHVVRSFKEFLEVVKEDKN